MLHGLHDVHGVRDVRDDHGGDDGHDGRVRFLHAFLINNLKFQNVLRKVKKFKCLKNADT